jgi:hypothetical protein
MKCHNETACIAIISKQKCLFSKNEGQESETNPVWELVPMGGGKAKGKGEGGQIQWKYSVSIYENGQMRHIETVVRRERRV